MLMSPSLKEKKITFLRKGKEGKLMCQSLKENQNFLFKKSERKKNDLPHGSLSFFFYILRVRVAHNFQLFHFKYLLRALPSIQGLSLSPILQVKQQATLMSRPHEITLPSFIR